MEETKAKKRSLEELGIKNQLIAFGMLGLFLGIWWIAAAIIDNPIYLPKPDAVFRLVFTNAAIWKNLFASFQRILKGVLLAVLIGTPIALVCNQVRGVKSFVDSTMRGFSYAPLPAFTTLFMLLFGIGETPKIGIILFACLTSFIPFCIRELDSVPANILNNARSQGFKGVPLLFHIVVRYSLPEVLRGIVMLLCEAWTYVLIAEAIACKLGIGHLIYVSGLRLKVSMVYACVVCIIFINWGTHFVLIWLLKKAFPARYANERG